ncbi:hypothetical protein JYU04_04270 [Dehalococcoides mccartyi]|nr:hypothetical protein [Dehalococcoides mccartyi]
MPTIRIDEQVYEWLQQQAKPFEDTPNTILRRVAMLDAVVSTNTDRKYSSNSGKRDRSASGRKLAVRENLKVTKAYYHWEGTWFQRVREFPVALFDKEGYVIFNSEREYLNHPDVEGSEKTNIPKGIASFSEYKKMSRPAF